jgi:hypothetical protein
VFGGKSPLDWGAVKLGMGVLNWGLGTAKAHGAFGGDGGGGGMAGGGGLAGLTGLIPSPGAAISAAAVPGGARHDLAAGLAGYSHNIDNSVTITGNTLHNANELVQNQQWERNSQAVGYSPRVAGYSTSVPVRST